MTHLDQQSQQDVIEEVHFGTDEDESIFRGVEWTEHFLIGDQLGTSSEQDSLIERLEWGQDCQ